jgi:hypothetical protein
MDDDEAWQLSGCSPSSSRSVAKACVQLEPDRAQSCRVVLAMARVVLDEVRLRAAAGPIDEPAG